MLNSAFIPEVVDADAINSQINDMQSTVNSVQSSVNTISSQNISIQNRLTQLEKDISADVLKTTENLTGDFNSSGSTTSITLSKDTSNYSKIIVKISAFSTADKNGGGASIPAQQVIIKKDGSAGLTFGTLQSGSSQTSYLCLGTATTVYHAGQTSCTVSYKNNRLLVTTDKRISIISGFVTVEYY